MKTIQLRPHHLICLLRFKKGGYKLENGHDQKYQKCKEIQKIAGNNPRIQLKIVFGFDDICTFCAYKGKKGCLDKKTDKLAKAIDKRIISCLKLKKNQVMPAGKAFLLALEKIPAEKIKEICRGCESIPICSSKKGLKQSFVKKLK
jgi:hypothetical protein